MFITRFKSPNPGRKYFKVIESYREGGIVKKRHIIGLAFHRTVELAYQSALKDYLKASDKLELNMFCYLCRGKGLKMANIRKIKVTKGEYYISYNRFLTTQCPRNLVSYVCPLLNMLRRL